MELRIKPHPRNQYPLVGILLKGDDTQQWLREIQSMNLDLEAVQVFPIPNLSPNSIWGCLLCGQFNNNKMDIGRNAYCQLAYGKVFIPEKAELFPKITVGEIDKLFGKSQFILHPDFGFFELNEPLDWSNILKLPQIKAVDLKQPQNGVFIPNRVLSFQVVPTPAEDVLQDLEKNVFPKKENFEDKPLNPIEKIKLAFYKTILSRNDGKTERTRFGKMMDKMLKSVGLGNGVAGKMEEDFEELMKRNQSQFEKLMELLKNNPEEALKYAIPLDNEGTSRGDGKGSFDLSARWFDYSLFGNNNRTGGGNILTADDTFARLNQQYQETAEALIRQKNYQKAAFVYLKLLKNNYKAAQTLEDGKLYQEAAAVYIKHIQNKQKAAECYEKGNMTTQAIELYDEMGYHEKVGDLYRHINQERKAIQYYEKVVDNYKEKFQYVKASLIYRDKIKNPVLGQSLLLEGWQLNRDAYNCLNNYLTNVPDSKQVGKEIKDLYENEVTTANSETFLQVIKHEFDKHDEIATSIREIAHEIIVNEAKQRPHLISELKSFEPKDPQLVKDIIRFKANKKK
jgi:tetratricopeptide (TPR) repeat protein